MVLNMPNINEFAINYEIPRIENTLRSLSNMVSIFGRENFNFIYQKRDLFKDNFPKQSWEEILTCLNAEETDFTEDFLSIDVKQTNLTINPLFNDYYNEIYNKRKHDPNFRQIILGEIQKANKLAEFYHIPLIENIHFNNKNSEKIILLNSSLEELTKLETLPKQMFIKSKKTNRLVNFKYFTN